jgi:hypothetical protein
VLVERSVPLVDHDAVAVRGGSDTLVFYAERLTRAQRRVLRAHLLALLCDDEPSVTIAVPAGWAAAEVSARQRRHEALTAGTILFSFAAAGVLAVFVAAVIVLVVNERRDGLRVAQAPIPSRDGGARPAPLEPVAERDARHPEQPPGASAPPAGIATQELRLPDDLARAGDARPALPVPEAATPEHTQLPLQPGLKPPDLPARPQAPRLPVDLPAPSVPGGLSSGTPDVKVPNDRAVEVGVPDDEVPDRNSGLSRSVDRGEDDGPEQDGAEDSGDEDHDSMPVREGDSGGGEQADGRGDFGVDLAG